MNKHIKKKFLHQVEITEDVSQVLKESGLSRPTDGSFDFKKIPKNASPFLYTEDNKFFKAFSFPYKNTVKLIPEPDPILIYFHAAYLNYVHIDRKKEEILNKLAPEAMNEVLLNELYEYFSLTSGFVVLLFTSIEALANRCIGKEYIHKKESKRMTETYSKHQIERYFSFEDKLEVIAAANSKNFREKYPLKYAHINNLKEFRDMIVHTKEAKEESTYDYLYRKALTFNYADTLDSVKDFCNFYLSENFIEECSCSMQW